MNVNAGGNGEHMDINNHPVPFYMTYPLPLYFEEERRRAREAEYLKSMYPADARKIQGIVENAMQILDYEGSMIYDEYPDKIMMRRLMTIIYDQIKDDESMKNKRDIVDILVIEDILNRRQKSQQQKI
ncbi:hypothetical protein D7X88_14855 [bacterium C-53]|nr:hypothetical protein [Lachnospiraceae bacterium]NBI04292.1 hypothetical protein [Lachnospiraceae bacterium]RKJ08462.1 hypothetical protein D7X88_14855 [bacterium C-53]